MNKNGASMRRLFKTPSPSKANQALRVLASVWAHSNASRGNARTLASMASTSKMYRNLIGNPSSFRTQRERRDRIQKILRRRRYLIEKMERRRTPLTAEERAFLEFFDLARWRGEAYLKTLAPGLRRQPVSLMFTRHPLYYNYNRYMRTVRPTMRRVVNGHPRFDVTPVQIEERNRYRTTGKPVIKFPGGSNKWKRAVQKALRQRKLFVRN